ncbi:hypothetical protein KAR91_72760 [Candidatus Pacearchaeota archaeon]|nr:hypothetical protein [Candidatus Pacearchaeota archaeon]
MAHGNKKPEKLHKASRGISIDKIADTWLRKQVNASDTVNQLILSEMKKQNGKAK